MRNLKLIDWYVGGLLLILFLVVLHAPLSVALGTLFPDISLLFKVWKEFLLLILSVAAIILISRGGRTAWRELARDWLIRLSVVYGLLHILLLGFKSQGAVIAAAGLAIDLRMVVMLVLTYIAVKLAPESLRLFKRAAVIGALVVVGFAALQLVLPVDSLKYIGYGDGTIQPYLTIDQNEQYVRHNSTLRGPNPLGAYAASVVLIALALLTARPSRSSKLTWLLSIGGLIAVVSSFSRSAALALGVGGLFILAIRYLKRLSRIQFSVIIVALIFMAGSFFLVRDSHFISHVVLHEDPNESGLVNSNDEHLRSLQNGSERMATQPLGAGIGSTGSASLYGEEPMIIENQYLYVAHETGWLGLLLFLGLNGLVLWRLWLVRTQPWALGLLASGLGLAVAALFLPVWADDTVAIVWWGMAGALLATKPEKGRN